MTTLPTPATPTPATPNQSDATAPSLPSPADPAGTHDDNRPGRRRSRAGLGKAIALVFGLAVIGGGAYLALADDDSGDTVAETATPVRTTVVEQRDLVEFSTLDGTLGYADSRSVVSAASGTVTSVVAEGVELDRGDELFRIDDRPTTVFFGDATMYRTLSEGDEGDDVLMLEQNLASLGHHVDTDADGEPVDTGFTVDGVFDAATTDAVLRWQADTGQEESGEVSQASIAVVPGPSVVSLVSAEAGAPVQPGSPILSVDIEGDVEAAYSEHAGELELVAAPGPVTTGTVLYVVDDRPITAVVTDEVMDRDLFLGVEDGADVEVVEAMLVAAGYDADGDLDVDEEFDEDTADAIAEWKEDLADVHDDVVIDSTILRSDLVVLAPGSSIESRSDIDEVVASGDELFTYAGDGAGRIVRTSIDLDEQTTVTVGAQFEIEFPGGETTVGTVTEVARTTTIDPTNPNAEPQLAVELSLAEVPETVAGFVELDVEINIVDREAVGAVVVPASALVATADGGFALEIVDAAGTTSYIGVTPGLFADGFVEVAGVEPGVTVVVPS